MKFSVCIPNYNYEQYIGRTIGSVLTQSCDDFEILVSDNASTDKSREVISSFKDERLQLSINACNVGFAGNLDKAARMATGDFIIMLSSDDLMRREALQTYRNLLTQLGEDVSKIVVSSAMDVIDSDDNLTGLNSADKKLWHESERVKELEKIVDAPVYRVAADVLLRRCLLTMKNPFNFAATCYPRALYKQIEGYSGRKLINPDKWFHWRLLGVADAAYFIDRPLFAYRWHASNQTAQEAETGALKYLVDEYVTTVELNGDILKKAKLTKEQVEEAFIENDIINHGLATLAKGQRGKARRILNFGRAAYPQYLRGNFRAFAFAALLKLKPLDVPIARYAYSRQKGKAQ
jgi:glycosyltransferase involved in cell wall biosynthesis